LKINFEKPIKWQWICLVFATVIVLLTVIIIVSALYNWRDFRFELLKTDYDKQLQTSDYLAKVLAGLNQNFPPEAVLQINKILEISGFPQYQRILLDSTKVK